MDKRKIKNAMALIGLMGILLYGACGSEKKEIPKQIYIGVACYDQRDTFLGELLEDFKRECRTLEKRGYDISLTIMDAANSQRTQDDQVQEMIGNGCDILCVNLADRTDPSQIITAAQEHDIPIIFFNREPVEEDLMQWDQLYYVGAEAKQSGQMQGQLAAAYIKEHPDVDRNHDGKIQYVILEGEMGHQDAIIRTESVVESLKEQGIALEKLSYQIANWNRVQAQNRMMQLIGQYNNRIEVVLANNDAMALGAMDAYEKLGYTETNRPVFFGIDGTKEGLEAVKDGTLAATVYNDGKIQYVILEGEMGHQDAIIRTESVVESLKEQGIALEKLSYQIANWNRVQAQNRMMQLIGQYNNRIEVVLANNDAMALGAMDAYEKLGYTETNRPVFFGIDGTKEGLEAVKDGTLAATVYNDKEGQAAAMANLAFSIATEDENNPNPFKNYKYIYRAYQKVTKENVQTFLEKEE